MNSTLSSCSNQNIESIVYYDGLGRSKQTIKIRAGAEIEDIITPVLYDEAGRSKRKYLPYANSSRGSNIHWNALSAQEVFYNTPKYEHTTNAYSENKYTSSTSNIIEELGAPGEDWRVQENSESSYSDQVVGFPNFHFNTNGQVTTEYETGQIINDYLFFDAKYESSNEFILTLSTFNNSPIDLYAAYGVTIDDNIELGYIKNEFFEDTPFRLKIIDNHLIFENTSALIYTSKVYRLHYSIPLSNNRVLSQHTIKNNESTNIENEVVHYNVSHSGLTPQLVDSGFYKEGALSKTITKDENWKPGTSCNNDGSNNTTQEFKNKQGQVILKRSFNNKKWHDTYYVYDDYGNLTFVLPPKLNTYASLWQQDNLSSRYFSNVFSLYETGLPKLTTTTLATTGSPHLTNASNSTFGDYNGPRVALKEGMVFDLGLEFDIPDGPLEGTIRISPPLLNTE